MPASPTGFSSIKLPAALVQQAREAAQPMRRSAAGLRSQRITGPARARIGGRKPQAGRIGDGAFVKPLRQWTQGG